MKQIQTEGNSLLVLEIPKTQLKSNTNDRLFWDYYKKDNPDDNKEYKILGKLSELSGEVCSKYVKTVPHRQSAYDLYYNYLSKGYSFGSPQESFVTLLQSNDVDINKEFLIIEIL